MQEYQRRIKLPEMAKLLSRSVKQFRVDVRLYNIPFIQLGRNKLFNPQEVEEHLSAQAEPKASSKTEKFPSTTSMSKRKRFTTTSEPSESRYKTLLGLR